MADEHKSRNQVIEEWVRAEAQRQRAETAISQHVSMADFDRARISLMKALVRLQVASRARMRS